MPRPNSPTIFLFALAALGLVSVASSGCTIEDVSDEIRVVELVPAPSGSTAPPHRIERQLTLGDKDTDRVEEGSITEVTLSVVSPEDASLFSFLRIDIKVCSSQLTSCQAGCCALATGTDFQEGERSRQLTVQFTQDITPFLQASDFTVRWEIYYKSQVGGFPSEGIRLESVVRFNVDIEII
jgi:hypothetical protein